MEKKKCPKCKKRYRKLHKISKRGLIYYLCYRCYKKEAPKDRIHLMRYHDDKLFNRMKQYYTEGDAV